jgi:uncharacterized protein
MSVGLLALLDDVAAIAKIAAASLDDTAAAAAKAGAKAAGVVIDDAAVTPRYVHGFAPARELPIVWKIALGSLRNKLLFLLPGALVLSSFAPWAITPLLMAGGAYLAFEGAEKLHEKLFPHEPHPGAEFSAVEAEADLAVEIAEVHPRALEDSMVSGAIRTDLILSAEIMAIALATVATVPIWEQAVALIVVSFGITAAVYGAVGMIVKMDDVGLALAAKTGDWAVPVRAFGRGLVQVMPSLLGGLASIGTAAMLWVGGGIIVHGLEGYGVAEPAHTIHRLSDAASNRVPAPLAGTLGWLVGALGAGCIGIVVGFAIISALSLRRNRASGGQA